MKKLSTALLLSTAFLAGSAQAQWDGNWLFGISEGGIWHSGDDDSAFTVTVGGVSETFNTNRHDDNDGHFIWGFLAGYQVRACNWLVGLEVNVNWLSDEDHHNFFAFSSTLGDAFTGTIHRDRDAIWGITGRFGYFINTCIMPYIRLGADHSDRDFDVSITRFLIDDDVLLGTVTASVDDDSNNRWSFVGGIGIEWFLPGCFSLRAEWDYHNRKHHDDAITAVASDGITTFSLNGGSGHHHEQTAIASLVYNF